MSLRDAINNATPEQIRAAQMIAEARAERDDAQADLTQIREAARELVEALASDHGARPWGCHECGVLATRTGADLSYCDDCDPGGFTGDLSHAPALRTLRKLLEGGGQ